MFFFVIILILSINQIYAQFDSVENKVFNNDSIKYHIAHVTPGVYTNPDVPVGMYFVHIDVPQIPKGFKEYLLKKDTAFFGWSIFTISTRIGPLLWSYIIFIGRAQKKLPTCTVQEISGLKRNQLKLISGETFIEKMKKAKYL